MTNLEILTEAVATTKREVWVATSLVSELRSKLRLAEEEQNDAGGRLRDAEYALSKAAIDNHASTHGTPISESDREAFDLRWSEYISEIKQARDRQRSEADKQ